MPRVTSERRESDRVADPARSLATETLSCSSARRTLASRTLTSWAALSASKNPLVVVSDCWNLASTREAPASASPALAAPISAPRRNPVKRSTLALREVLMLRLLLLPELSSPVTGSTREAPSAKKSLADELAVSEGRKLPQALRRWA